MSFYHRASAVILNNQYGRDKNSKCLKHEDAAIKQARASMHPDAKKQLAAVLLNKTQTLLETGSKMKLCCQMLEESAQLLHPYPYGYEHYHFDCVAAMFLQRLETRRPLWRTFGGRLIMRPPQRILCYL